MEKRKMTVTVAGRPYTLVSSDPPEHVKRVADYVDRTLSETAAVTNLPSGQAAVLAYFRLAEELLKAQDENRVLQHRLEEAARKPEAPAERKPREQKSADCGIAEGQMRIEGI